MFPTLLLIWQEMNVFRKGRKAEENRFSLLHWQIEANAFHLWAQKYFEYESEHAFASKISKENKDCWNICNDFAHSNTICPFKYYDDYDSIIQLILVFFLLIFLFILTSSLAFKCDISDTFCRAYIKQSQFLS